MRKKLLKQKQFKKAYCFLVEGKTEEHYINLLKKIYEKVVRVECCNGGGANGVLKYSKKYVADNKGLFSDFIILYDEDTRARNIKIVEKREKELDSLKYSEVKRIVFNPCFEQWILWHFKKKKENTCEKVTSVLKKYIPDYQKNDFEQIEKYIDKEKIQEVLKLQTTDNFTEIINQVFN